MKLYPLGKIAVLFFLITVNQTDVAFSADKRFTVNLSNFTFEKETFDLQNGTSTVITYKASRTRDDLGFKGTFNAEQGLYEVYWSPPQDEGYIKREMSIKVFLTEKFSHFRAMNFLRYDFWQETNDPQDPADLGIHSWFLELPPILLKETSGTKMKFELSSPQTDTFIEDIRFKYEMINQGNPRFRSIEKIKSVDADSKITVELDIGEEWYVDCPDIELYYEPDFGSVKMKMDTPVKKQIRIFNAGNVILNISKIWISEEDFPFFLFEDSLSSCSQVASGSSCTFDVGFLPYKCGKYYGSVGLESDDPDESLRFVHLRGRCIPRLSPSVPGLLLSDP